MKKILKLIFAIMLITSMNMTTVLAEPDDEYMSVEGISLPVPEIEADFTLDNTYSIIVAVRYEGTAPVVWFEKPNGDIVMGSELETEENAENNFISYIIPDASSGTWTVFADKDCEIEYGSYMESINITSLAVSEAEDNYMEVEFLVESVDDGGYNYEIYAVVLDEDGNVSGEKLLTSGSAYLNDSVKRGVNLSSLLDFDDYRIRLDVWQAYGVEEVFDSMITDKGFKVSENDLDTFIENYRVTVDLDNETITVNWEEWANNYADEYFLSVSTEGSTEPFYFDQTSYNIYANEFSFDKTLGNLELSLIYRDNGKNSAPKNKTVVIDDLPVFDFPESGITNAKQMLIGCSNIPADGIITKLSVNGKDSDITLNNDSKFSINLESDYNEIIIMYSLDDELTEYKITYNIVVDNLPPALSLPEHKEALPVTSKSFKIAGITDPGASVTVAGSAVTVNEDGTFVEKVELSDGENIIRVEASDKAGNVSAQDVILVYGTVAVAADAADSGEDPGFIEKYSTWIISLLIAIILFAIIVIVTSGFSKTKNKLLFCLRTAKNLMLALIVVCIAGAIFCAFKSNELKHISETPEFVDIQIRSYEDAYDLLMKIPVYDGWFWGLIITAIVTAVLTAVIIVLICVCKMPRKPKPEKKQEKYEDFYVNERVESKSDIETNETPTYDNRSDASKVDTDAESDADTRKRGFNAPPDFGAFSADVPGDKETSDAVVRLPFCKECGTKIENPNSKFCKRCGSKLM